MKDESEMNEDRVPIGTTPFSVLARVAIQLGRESISNSVVAISELVKNAYDADADSVKISFSGLNTKAPVLTIEDDGLGMTETQLLGQWMIIGTSNKLQTGTSARKNRVLTGEKGLGRLGLDRLCRKTVVQTFAESEPRGIELVIDWDKYEELGKRLEEVNHELYSIPKHERDPNIGERVASRGTRLVLSNLRDAWTKELLLELKNELTLLVSPFAGINDFSIELDSGMGWDGVDGVIGSGLMLRAAEWNLRAEISAEGNVTYAMTSSQYKESFLFGPKPWQEAFPKKKKKIPECGPLTFDMYFFPRRDVALTELSLSRSQVGDFLDANQGIRIYRDGFRVKPYGQPDGRGDWLTLSYRRQQSPQGVRSKPLGGWRVGYNQVVGAVFISREKNAALLDQTNRESIVEGEAFYDLVAFASEAVRFFELERQTFELNRKDQTAFERIQAAAERTSQASQSAIDELESTVNRVKRAISESREQGIVPDLVLINSLLDGAVKEVRGTWIASQRAQRALSRATKERTDEFQREKDTLGNLASLGILTTSFGHETLASSNLVLENAQQLQKNLQTGLFMVLPDVRADIDDNLKILIEEAKRIETFASFALRNVRRDKRTRTDVDLSDLIRKVFSHFRKSLREKHIQSVLDLPKKASLISAFKIDWESIIVNLITNSVWALEDTPASKRKIRVSLREVDGYIEIAFADSGVGVPPELSKKVFLPTFSTKRNDKGQIIGTGMGLTIVKDLVESYEEGSIRVESPCDLNGAQFYVRVRIPIATTD